MVTPSISLKGKVANKPSNPWSSPPSSFHRDSILDWEWKRKISSDILREQIKLLGDIHGGAVKISNRTSTFSTSFYRSNISLQTWYLLYPPFLGGPSGLCFLKNVVAFYPWMPHRGIHGNLPRCQTVWLLVLACYSSPDIWTSNIFPSLVKFSDFISRISSACFLLCFKPFQLMACSEGS